jgi:hypothetical protein
MIPALTLAVNQAAMRCLECNGELTSLMAATFRPLENGVPDRRLSISLVCPVCRAQIAGLLLIEAEPIEVAIERGKTGPRS